MNEQKQLRRVLGFLLTLILTMSLFSVSVFAGEISEQDKVILEECENEETESIEIAEEVLALSAQTIPLNKTKEGMIYWDAFGDTNIYTVRVSLYNDGTGKVIEYTNITDTQFNLKANLDKDKKETRSYSVTVFSSENGKQVETETIAYYYVSSLAKLAEPQNLYWDGYTARWDSVQNATAYEVALMNSSGGRQYSRITSETCYDFTGDLNKGYYFTVVATADGYRDSNAGESPIFGTYNISVNGGHAAYTTTGENAIGIATARETVYLFPEIPDGYEFVGWTVNSPSSLVLSDTLPAFFVMPSSPVSVTANFKGLPIITKQPDSVAYIDLTYTESVTLTIEATNAERYRWMYKDGDEWNVVYNGTNPTYEYTGASVNGFTSEDYGRVFRCEVRNNDGSVYSREVTLTKYNSLNNYERNITVPEPKVGAKVDFSSLYSSDTYGLADTVSLYGFDPIDIYKCNADGTYCRDNSGNIITLKQGDKFENGYRYEFSFHVTLPDDICKPAWINSYFNSDYYPVINGTPCEPDSFDYEEPYACHVFWMSPVVTCSHDTKETVTTKATLTVNGKTEIRCKDCGEVIKSTTIYYPKTFALAKTSYVYTGSQIKPAITIKDRNGATVAATNYTVTYGTNKSVGKGTVKVTFKGNYSGTKTVDFKINPKGTTLSTLTATKAGFKASWKKQATQTTGYQIQYSRSSSFTKPKLVTITSNSTLSKTVSKLKAKKKYYVRVRTYKTVSGTKYYSAWSKSKYVTTK